MEAGRRGRSRTRSTSSAFRPTPADLATPAHFDWQWRALPNLPPILLGPAKTQPIRDAAATAPASWKAVGGRQFLSTLVGLSHFSRPSGRLHQALEFGDCLQFRGLGRSRVSQRGAQSREGLPYRGTPDGFVRPRARAGVAEGRGRCSLKGGWAGLAQTSSAPSPREVSAAEPLSGPLPPWPADLEAHPGMEAAATAVQGKRACGLQILRIGLSVKLGSLNHPGLWGPAH